MADIAGRAVNQFIAEFLAWQEINEPSLPPTPAVNVVARYNARRLTPYAPDPQQNPPAASGPSRTVTIIRPDNKPPLDPAPPPGIFHTWTAPIAPSLYAAANWRGVKQLGAGSFGTVTLWEYSGALPRPRRDKIAVKLGRNPTVHLRNEGRYMGHLKLGNSKHIVELLVSPTTRVTLAMVAAEALGPGWTPPTGRVRRLIMEYCPQGSMQKLRKMRHARNIRFEELTLWRIFECLVDGCTVLEHGAEYQTDNNGVPQIPNTSPIYGNNRDRGVLVHFDLKPENSERTNMLAGELPRSTDPLLNVYFAVMNGDRNPPDHPDTPVCKIGDFGVSKYIPRAGVQPKPNWGSNEHDRYRGTRGYFAPEQFSQRWNHVDYITGNICGRYGTATNVWGIGQIMYEPSEPFTPNTIHGQAPRGRVFGNELQAIRTPALSVLLKDTIQECLYETPAHRPDLLTLKIRITNAIVACLASDANQDPPKRPEGWQNLNRLEPLTPAQALLMPEKLRRCTRTIRPGRGRCGNKIKVRDNISRVRCSVHWDLRDFPYGG